MAFLDKFSPSPGGAAARGDPRHALAERVVDNLRHILDTHREYGWFRPDFGMSDPDPHASPAKMAEALMRDVRENIERHEPRIRIREIATAPAENPLRLAFTVRCLVLDDARTLHLEFDALFKSFSLGSR